MDKDIPEGTAESEQSVKIEPVVSTATYQGPDRRGATLEFWDRVGNAIIGKKKIMAAIICAQLLMLGFIAVGVILLAQATTDQVHKLEKQVDQNGEIAERVVVTGENARIVADFVKVCILGPVDKRTPAQCGQQDGGASVVKGLVTYMNCAFLIIPEERTDAQLTACAAKGFGQ